MFLDNVYNTSSFRLTLTSVVIFSVALSLLFYLTRWSSDVTVTHEIEASVSSETREVFNNARGKGLDGVIAIVGHMSKMSPRFFYVLQDSKGERLAGNMPTIQPILGFHNWREQHLTLRGRILKVHGLGVSAPNNSYLFVGLSTARITEPRHVMNQAFFWLTALTFLVVLSSGLLTSNHLLHRVEAINHASQEIINGDLERRIPIRGANDEFDRLAISLNEMLDRIQGLMNSLRQVSSDVAHDLRTPLTRLRHRLEHARDKATTMEELREVLDQSISQVDSILTIFSSLLRIAQIESRTRRSGFKTLDLAPILRDAVDLYMPVAEEKNQALIAHIPDGLIISGDSELLRLLFINLIDNATKHCTPSCWIDVHAGANATEVFVEIADNGPGVREDDRGKVFQRFYRLEQSRSTPGYGLGMSFVAAVADLHDATVDLLDNRPGLRVRVVFTRPTPPMSHGKMSEWLEAGGTKLDHKH